MRLSGSIRCGCVCTGIYTHSVLGLPESTFRLRPLTVRLPFFPFFFAKREDKSDVGGADAIVDAEEISTLRCATAVDRHGPRCTAQQASAGGASKQAVVRSGNIFFPYRSCLPTGWKTRNFVCVWRLNLFLFVLTARTAVPAQVQRCLEHSDRKGREREGPSQ